MPLSVAAAAAAIGVSCGTVYCGSFRSLRRALYAEARKRALRERLEEEGDEEEEEEGEGGREADEEEMIMLGMESLTLRTALLFPVMASAMLMVLFFLFRYVQLFMLGYMVTCAGVAMTLVMRDVLSEHFMCCCSTCFWCCRQQQPLQQQQHHAPAKAQRMDAAMESSQRKMQGLRHFVMSSSGSDNDEEGVAATATGGGSGGPQYDVEAGLPRSQPAPSLKSGAGYPRKLVRGAAVALTVVCLAVWAVTGHWALNNAIGICLILCIMEFARVPSLRIAACLLAALFVYDIFWVFGSPYLFRENVMVEVATKQAANPVQHVGESLNVPVMRNSVQELQMPVKLMFPVDLQTLIFLAVPASASATATAASSASAAVKAIAGYLMLGLGDIAIPGLVISMALRFDHSLAFPEEYSSDPTPNTRGQHKDNNREDDNQHDDQNDNGDDRQQSERKTQTTKKKNQKKREKAGYEDFLTSPHLKDSLTRFPKRYFNAAMIAYVCSLILCFVCGSVFQAAQPALLYIVPAILLTLAWRARANKHLTALWLGMKRNQE